MVCWALTFLFTALGTFPPSDATQRALFAWGNLFGYVAVILSGWAIISHYTRRERVRMEDLARIMAAEAVRAEHEYEPSGGRPVFTLHQN